MQAWSKQYPSLLDDQNLQSLTDLYRPVRNSDWILAAFSWYVLPSKEVQMGWGRDKDRKL